MSHITKIKTKIKFKNKQILEQVLKEMGEVTTHITDYYGTKRKVDLAVKVKQFRRGIGFVWNGSEYEILCDSWGHQIEVDRLVNQIQKLYIEKSLTTILTQQGFVTTVQRGVKSTKIRATQIWGY